MMQAFLSVTSYFEVPKKQKVILWLANLTKEQLKNCNYNPHSFRRLTSILFSLFEVPQLAERTDIVNAYVQLLTTMNFEVLDESNTKEAIQFLFLISKSDHFAEKSFMREKLLAQKDKVKQFCALPLIVNLINMTQGKELEDEIEKLQNHISRLKIINNQ